MVMDEELRLEALVDASAISNDSQNRREGLLTYYASKLWDGTGRKVEHTTLHATQVDDDDDDGDDGEDDGQSCRRCYTGVGMFYWSLLILSVLQRDEKSR